MDLPEDTRSGLLAEVAAGDNSPPLSVSELSGALKRTIEDAFGRVRVRGEISGFKRHASGHCYFTLKDEGACIDAVIWRGQAGLLRFAPEDGIEVVATAVDGQDAVEQALALRPDVCLLDIRMPRMNGIDATLALAGPDVPDPLAVVVVTTFDLDDYVYGALRAGARGFLLKDCGPQLLTHAVRAAADGGSLIAPTVTTRLLRSFATKDAPPEPVARLTDREEQVLVAVARGLTNHEVAAELYISLSTVKTHLGSLMSKLGVRNRVELALWAYQTRRLD